VAVQTRMEQSFFTRNVGYVLLRVRCCVSYRDWNAHTGLRDIEWVEHGFPVLRLAELQELLIDRQIGYHLASLRQLRQDPRCSAKRCATLSSQDDYKDQIHDETARQSRSALGIGLIIFVF